MRFSFPKSEKLCKLAHIQQLFSEGESVQSFPLKMIFTPIDGLNVPFQLLVSVPKKGVKKANKRNRIKRLIRESYRLQKHFLVQNTSQSYALALIFTGKEMPDYELISQKVIRCFEKFTEAVNQKTKTLSSVENKP
ncbi:ribonuclease P protein component [Capnocytophaga sp.]|uniref:ribonuclease P protein component n=1 Tax=Capnocytophaga sp. TaxID=44737 RepID=UPI0026DCD333|nr:ribonuclease P protein component [Capnocytophaga sp.]MDO5105781.1 ribonuclease P protein component [Capnocytophaga sp.]